MYKVIVVCDDPLKRPTFKVFIESLDNMQVILSNLPEESTPNTINTEKADLILIDIDESKASKCLNSISQLKKQAADTKIIMLTDNLSYFDYMTGLGISGILPKKSTPEHIIRMIHTVQEGQTIIPITVLHRILFKNHVDKKTLTDIEKNILTFVIKGYTNAKIAKEIFVSTRTVEKKLSVIYEKLGVHSRIEAVEKITREKMV
ncbi:response regulator transcription factor [Paenibacillus elgii]|uniref:response regulator transcription factor n=1 Tax=Paenibacillus elgii TaxID=189691 RepID=UPI00203FCE9B|nr:response regulator transcription factor [Paenibacillus elgii]MCM3270655.1 response regulator transcription factor [Paenibacillus elgii]